METAATNYIADTNRWNLPKPPAWVLSMFLAFDDQLVMIPSRMRREYLLTRRRSRSATLANMVGHEHPDTIMCIQHDVLPIAPLRFKDGFVTWTKQSVDGLLDELRRRDMWAISGGTEEGAVKIITDLEDTERYAAEKDAASLRDKFYHMGKDAYRSLKARIGERNKRASDYHGHART